MLGASSPAKNNNKKHLAGRILLWHQQEEGPGASITRMWSGGLQVRSLHVWG